MPEQPAPTQRLTLSRIIELLLGHQAAQSYVQLGRTGRGDVTIDVRVMVDGADGGAPTLDAAIEQARAAYDALASSYQAGTAESPATVSLTRNAKGETQVDVQLRSSDVGEHASPADVVEQATEAYRTLRRRFPLASGMVGAEGHEHD